MWSHYANSHQGFCIGFYEEKIRNYVVKSRNGGKGGMVIYDSKFPEIDPLNTNEIQDMFYQPILNHLSGNMKLSIAFQNLTFLSLCPIKKGY